MKSIKFNNRAKWVGKKGQYDYFDWEVYVDEADQVLESIKHVVYFLHKTFPDPIRTISRKEEGFVLKSRGWGEFEIGIQIFFKNGETSQQAYHLDLSKPWERADT
jgi:transcription initiation factor IIF auxiliary subunit